MAKWNIAVDWYQIADSLFERIKHGDEAHQKWLKDELMKWADEAYGD